MRAIKITGYVIFLLVIVTGLYFFGTLWSGDQFERLHPHFDGTCARLSGATGAEDLEMDYGHGQLFMSAMDRRAYEKDPTTLGAIYRLSLSDPNAQPEIVSNDAPRNFRPHGISIYRDNAGTARLFAVSHPTPKSSTVEIFDIGTDGTLTHAQTIKDDDAMISVNDLTAVGPDKFYFTNDSGVRGGFIKYLEFFLRLPTGSVFYYDGSKATRVAKGLAAANGIVLNSTGEILFVAETNGFGIQAYQRDPATGSLTPLAKIRLKTYADNLNRDPDGNVWVAAHPRIFQLLGHMSDPRKRSPSQVIKIGFSQNNEAIAEEVFLNDGVNLSGSSAVAVSGKTLFIGPVFDKHILRCKMN